MSSFYERYQQGHYQDVYDELLAMEDRIYTSTTYEDAYLVMSTLMRRVRLNIELLLPRLQSLGFVFDMSEDIDAKKIPPFRPPSDLIQTQIAQLERFVERLPLSLKCFYQEVGTVNFVGLFPGMKRDDGPRLDPLLVFSIEIMLQQREVQKEFPEEDPMLILAGDCFHKYGYSGGGTYDIYIPCYNFDAPFDGEPHDTTFVNYLRKCFQWGGFPGLEEHPLLAKEKLEYLTKDLLLF